MFYREIPLEEMCEAYEYLDDAERTVNGRVMRGGLWHRRLRRVVTGTLTDAPTSSAQFGFGRKVWFLHRVIFAMMNGGVPRDVLVDHEDRDRSHNRIRNLRALTASQNQMNRGASRVGSTSPYLGVCTSDGMYAAFVSEKSKPIFLGRFSSAEDAARARDAEVRMRHGGYATLNSDLFPELINKD